MRAALIVACFVVGCGFDRGGLGTTAPGDALPGSGDGAAIDDASELGDDAVPVGAITYFRGATCPVGWAPYEPVRGRLVVATIGAKKPGTTAGEPLAGGEDRTHTHGFSLSFTLRDRDFVTVAGGSNGGVGGASKPTATGTTTASSTGLPYVQLLVCRKESKPLSRSLPIGMTLFFESAVCPMGWTQTEVSAGRSVVGLPKGAPADQTFGRGPTVEHTHAHSAMATFATTPHGLTVLSGCCAGGYAAQGTYTTTAETTAESPDLPTIELLSCTKV